MGKKINLLVLLLFIAHACLGQVNTYFLNNPQWKIDLHVYSGMDCFGFHDVYNYNETGDTVIGSFTYKKILKKGIHETINSMCNPTSSTNFINTGPSCCLRSAGKQMYIVEAGNTTEELLYDFNLNVGDTLPPSYSHPAAQIITVTAIDSIFTPYGFRKKYSLSGTSSLFLYEGIGSSAGLIEGFDEIFLSGTCDLICFSLNDVRYVPTAGGSCNIFLGLNDIEQQGNSTAFPNPFSKSTSIQLNHTLKNASLNLFNSTGRKVRCLSFSGDKVAIERENLSEGMYYYQVVQEDGKIVNGKLLIVD